MESFEDFCQKSCDDDIGLTLTFYGNIKFAFRAIAWEEFNELVEDSSAEVNKRN